jgi:hypothetical protein
MLKRLVELVIAAAIFYAAWHAGVVYLHYFQFQDGLEETARFGRGRTEAQLRERVVQLAAEHQIPLDPGTVLVQTDNNATRIRAPYIARVQLLPNYVYEVKLEPTGDSWHIQP